MGVPTVGDADYEGASRSTCEQRALVAALLADDGWSP
jgi:hypothetical protein